MTPKLVLFDCDGVLVDSEPLTNVILQEDLARHGLHLTREQIMTDFVGGTMRSVGEKARVMGADLAPTWLDDIYARIYARLAEGTPLIPGIEAVLDRLDAAGIPYAVGSNGSQQKMDITLGQHPALMARLKDNIFSAHTHGVAKPEPGLFLLAAERFGLPPEECAVVDDSPTGCIAARRAGMRGFGFAEHDDGTRLAAEGATVFHAMDQLPGLLGL